MYITFNPFFIKAVLIVLFLVSGRLYAIDKDKMTRENQTQEILSMSQLDLFKSLAADPCNKNFEFKYEFETLYKQNCEILTKSSVCNKVEKSRLVQCSDLKTRTDISFNHFFVGCARGLVQTPIDLVSSVKGILNFTWSHLSSRIVREKTSDKLTKTFKEATKSIVDNYNDGKLNVDSLFNDKLFSILVTLVKAEHKEYECLSYIEKSKLLCNFTSSLALGSSASKFINPKPDDVISLKLIGENALHRSQLSYSKLFPLSGRKVSKVEKKLKSSEVIGSEILGGGMNKTFLITLKSGQKGVWKPHVETDLSNYRTEVLAYEIDRKLGLKLVPPTVERTINGKKGSLQLFVKNKKDNDGVKESELDKQMFFDYLIDNSDRHSGNFLQSNSDKLISIDNGLSMMNGHRMKELTVIEKMRVGRFLATTEGHKVMVNLKEINTKAFSSEISDYVGSKSSYDFMERISTLNRFYSLEVLD